MKYKTLIPIYCAVFLLLLLPSIAGAQIESPFYVETIAEYNDGEADDNDFNYNAADMPPVDSWSEILSDNEDHYAEAGALIDFSEDSGLDVAVHAFADNYVDDLLTYSRGYAYASIDDIFTAENPMIRFTYNFEYWIEVEGFAAEAHAYNEVSATLTVYNTAYEDPIYNNMFIYGRVEANGEEADDAYDDGTGWFDVPLTVGNEFRARLEVSETAYAGGDSYAGAEAGEYPDLFLTVDVEAAPAIAVAPEPISSTLFIVGGATLGFRRFRNRFKKSNYR